MEPEVEARFQRIESILHAIAERENRMEIRFDQKHAQAMQRLDRMEKQQAKHDKQIQATANLVRAGMKMVMQQIRDTKEMKAEMREIARRQDAFLRAFRNGRNGHSHK